MGGEEADPACWARTEPARGGSSLLPEDQGSSSPWQSPQGLSPSQPRETRPVGEAAGKSHGQLQGDGSCQPSTPATTASREQVSAAAQRLPPAHRPPPPAMTIVTCAGGGDVAAGILRGTLATGTACFSPARFQLLRGFCSERPQLCQGRAQWLTQALQEATGKETSSTSSPPQPPTQLRLHLDPSPKPLGRTVPGLSPETLAPPQREAQAQVSKTTVRNSTTKGPPPPPPPPTPQPGRVSKGITLPRCRSWQSCLAHVRSPVGRRVGVGSLPAPAGGPASQPCPSPTDQATQGGAERGPGRPPARLQLPLGADNYLPGVLTWDWLLWHSAGGVGSHSVIILHFNHSRAGGGLCRSGQLCQDAAPGSTEHAQNPTRLSEEPVTCRDREQERTLVSR